ncbi:hypothetical protein J2X31_002303 [Flavobacterium arsenatis]|uniref:EpsG family protein n=1 Tax=Flavobacterium arsenatis TaxID=1484332 RepID=A0ABU1TQN2_9FLAO|nr:EpsG family protein [Flavobacterium arsenatis]MDR6968286.1 hypothetical protein [Flavobacterium arsenatis]
MIYFLVLFFLIILIMIFDIGGRKQGRNFFYKLTGIIFVLIAGLRWKVGGDSLIYQNVFENNLAPIYDFKSNFIILLDWNVGFTGLMSICKTVVDEFWFFQFIQAIIVNIVLFKFFRKYTDYIFTAVFLYGYFYFFNYNMEILREVLAICIFLFVYKFLEEKKLAKFYIGICIAMLFHTSASILLLFPLLKQLKLNVFGIGILLSLFIVLMTSVALFPVILDFLSFSENTSSKIAFYSSREFSFFGTVYNFLCFVGFPAFLYYFNKINKIDNKFDVLVFPYFFIALLLVAVPGFGRFINYFGPFLIVYFANTICFVMRSKRLVNVRMLLCSIFFFFPMYYKTVYYFSEIQGGFSGNVYKRYEGWLPYSSVFDKEEDDRRLDIHSGTLSRE